MAILDFGLAILDGSFKHLLRLSAIESVARFARIGTRAGVEPTMNQNACARSVIQKSPFGGLTELLKSGGSTKKFGKKAIFWKFIPNIRIPTI
jgi:hypothetical protein